MSHAFGHFLCSPIAHERVIAAHGTKRWNFQEGYALVSDTPIPLPFVDVSNAHTLISPLYSHTHTHFQANATAHAHTLGNTGARTHMHTPAHAHVRPYAHARRKELEDMHV